MPTAENAPQMVRLTYVLPAKMRGSVFTVRRPASTAVYVSQLVDPAWFVEVDVIAAGRTSEL